MSNDRPTQSTNDPNLNAEREKDDVAMQEAIANGQVHQKTVEGSEALAEALLKEPPQPRHPKMITLYMICLLAFMCSSINGYDGSLMGSMLVMPAYEQQFGASIVGIKSGYITSMYTIGGVCALPFVGPALDTWGRRVGMFIGCAIVILGTIVEGTSAPNGLPQFLGGRFFLGFGYSIAAAAGPTYVVEMSHPAYRGVITGLYNCFYYVGAIVAAGTTRATVTYAGNAQWLIPTWIQMLMSGLVVLFVFFLPESPRWLFTNGKREQATAIMTKYHGLGNPDSEYVRLQLQEFNAQLEMDGADKRWWDYRALFKSKAAFYRLFCNCMVAIFGQWAGNGVVSYYLPALLSTAGIHSPVEALDINLGITLVSAAAAITGGTLVDKIGRRRLLIPVQFILSLIWVAVTVGTAIFNGGTGPKGAATASIVFVFFFSMVYSFAYTPLQALYPVEVLSYEQRAKGMAFSSLAVNAASLLNQFAWPVALQKIAWKTYIVFAIWCAIQGIVLYFTMVETKGRTLEELDEIFNAKNPRKASTAKKVLVVDDAAHIVAVKEVV